MATFAAVFLTGKFFTGNLPVTFLGLTGKPANDPL
jgi:hypothetical protein